MGAGGWCRSLGTCGDVRIIAVGSSACAAFAGSRSSNGSRVHVRCLPKYVAEGTVESRRAPTTGPKDRRGDGRTRSTACRKARSAVACDERMGFLASRNAGSPRRNVWPEVVASVRNVTRTPRGAGRVGSETTDGIGRSSRTGSVTANGGLAAAVVGGVS